MSGQGNSRFLFVVKCGSEKVAVLHSSDITQSCVNTLGNGIEGMECVTLYTSVLFEFPPISMTLAIKRKKNKFEIPWEIISCWSSVFIVHIMVFLETVLP